MTNQQIIFGEAQRLAEEGKIAYTGREFIMQTPDGEQITVKETEDIHTFNGWKARGMKVKKGEHAVAKFVIWKHSGPKVVDVPQPDGDVAMIDRGKMFMKMSAFFSASQVEPMRGEG